MIFRIDSAAGRNSDLYDGLLEVLNLTRLAWADGMHSHFAVTEVVLLGEM